MKIFKRINDVNCYLQNLILKIEKLIDEEPFNFKNINITLI